MTTLDAVTAARRIHVRGVVQGVGFRPYVWRLARAHRLHGWVRNGGDGVHIHVEGDPAALDAFVRDLVAAPPPAAVVTGVEIAETSPESSAPFAILDSEPDGAPTTRIAPDLPVCDHCLSEMCDAGDRRYRYPYINCTNCGPRYSIVRTLPYDRRRTTMAAWPMCAECAAEYHDPADRRFHAQPVACSACGPTYVLFAKNGSSLCGADAIGAAAALLRSGRIVAVKGIGGYHLACDADNAAAVSALRERKYRKEQPFAVMVRDLGVAESTVDLTAEVEALLRSTARPIVLADARMQLAGVAPDQGQFGVMLPYTPLHHLLFDAGAPCRLVMTSGNRSSEPIAYDDEDARRRLAELADAFLAGGRPIARRVDDSVVGSGAFGPMILRRSRGLAPSPVATLPSSRPILALGGDLKNSIALVVGGEAFVSQHIGDLAHHDARHAFEQTIRDLLGMYDVRLDDLLVVHDAHPQYVSSALAATLGAGGLLAVQHHRAHVASVLAERGVFDHRVLGVTFDGTGFGDDGTIWGGEVFVGSLRGGFERVAHLRPAMLAGGDAAARHPVQAAAGFLAEVDVPADLARPPFCFPVRYAQARAVLRSRVRTFATTSAGRLFDTVAALAGFTRSVTFEGQAAMWLEHEARPAVDDGTMFDMPFADGQLDWRPTIRAVIETRAGGAPIAVVARAFHRSLAHGLATAVDMLARTARVDTVVLSGGVMQNRRFLSDLRGALPPRLIVWTNRDVPPNDGGLSLGQAALAAMSRIATGDAPRRV